MPANNSSHQRNSDSAGQCLRQRAALESFNTDKNLQVSLEDGRPNAKPIYTCNICFFNSKLKTIVVNHLRENHVPKLVNDPVQSHTEESSSDENAVTTDMFWNYKNREFMIDAVFSLTSHLESYGDGLGCYIVNKILLPIFHGLKHSNYSNSIHRFIARVLCEATPKEGLKLVHERFSNRKGKPGCNIARDWRMEYLIGTLKKLINNLGGPNFNEESVKQV